MKALTILMWLLFSTVDLREQTSNDTATSLRDNSCPPWQVRNKTGICKCVIGDIHGIVRCRDEPYSLQLLECFCMTYYTDTNTLVTDIEMNTTSTLQLILLLNSMKGCAVDIKDKVSYVVAVWLVFLHQSTHTLLMF